MPMNPRREIKVERWQDAAVFAVGTALLFVLAYTVRQYFSPFVALAAVFAVLYPLRRSPHVKGILATAVGLFLIWFIGELVALLTPFIVSLVLAYIFSPVVDSLERRRVPRWGGALIGVAGSAAVIVAALVFLGPLVAGQFKSFLLTIAPAVSSFVQQMNSGELIARLQAMGIPADPLREQITREFGPRLEQLLSGLMTAALGLLSNVGAIATQIVNVILVPVLTFHMLKDFHKVRNALLDILPGRARVKVVSYGARIDTMLGLYLRGALTVAFIVGSLSTFLLWIAGINYPFVLGPLAGMLDLIPYFGILTILIVSVIVALLSGGNILLKALFVVFIFGGINFLETTFLQPRIVGRKVGIHPLLLILALIVFGYFLGFAGLLIAVPTTAILLALLKDERRLRKERGAAAAEISE